ncbi:MAG: hypothetical protein ACJAUD_002908 [Crocinitomicaceae bacterium]|jgi:hypothetical protein
MIKIFGIGILILYFIFIVIEILKLLKYIKPRKIKLSGAQLFQRLNYFLLILAIGLFSWCISFRVNIFEYESPILYENNAVITLQNFKGLNLPGNDLDGQKEFAFIETSISIEESSNSIFVGVYFHPSRSYVFNKKLIDRSLLKHEMYHFHITEYIARLIRKDLSNSKTLPSSSEINKIEKHYKILEKKMQRRYDHESYHGYILQEQQRWERNIDSLLSLHSNYSQTKVNY